MSHRTCQICGTDISTLHGNRKSCSTRCSNRAHDLKRRVPCDTCGELTWPSRERTAPTCLPCRRAAPTYQRRDRSQPQRWTCAKCGRPCEREATKGQKPKLCPGCRSHRGWISDQRRLSLYERDNWHCWLCNQPVDPQLRGTHSKWRPSLDHVIPRSLEGDDSDINLKTSHWICNASRGNRVEP